MKITAFCLVVVMAGAAFAVGQEAPGAQAPSPRAFKLDLQPLYAPGYEPAREVRLALWNPPMSRLELAVPREQWPLRSPGPAGNAVPFQVVPLPSRFLADTAGRSLVVGPWNSGWDQLTWREKVATGAQATLVALVLVQIARHVR